MSGIRKIPAPPAPPVSTAAVPLSTSIPLRRDPPESAAPDNHGMGMVFVVLAALLAILLWMRSRQAKRLFGRWRRLPADGGGHADGGGGGKSDGNGSGGGGGGGKSNANGNGNGNGNGNDCSNGNTIAAKNSLGDWLGNRNAASHASRPRLLSNARLTARQSLHTVQWQDRLLLLACADQAVTVLRDDPLPFHLPGAHGSAGEPRSTEVPGSSEAPGQPHRPDRTASPSRQAAP